MASTKWKAFRLRHEVLFKVLRIALIAVVALLALTVIIMFIIGNTVAKDYNSESFTFIVPRELCLELVQSEPNNLRDDFVSQFKKTGTDYKVDSDGNLVLTVGDGSAEAVCKWYQKYVDNAVKNNKIKVSDDYTRVEFNANSTYNTEGTLSLWAVMECAWIQLYSGVPAEDIKVDVVAMDYATNEVVYQATWPKEDIVYVYSDDHRTITYSIKDGISNVYQMPIKGSAAQPDATLDVSSDEYIMDKTPSEFSVDDVKNITIGLIDVDISVEKQVISSVDDAIEYGQLLYDEYKRSAGIHNSWVMTSISYDEASNAWLTTFSEPPLHPGECVSIAFYSDGEIIAFFAGE